jgi:hypothetical protein
MTATQRQALAALDARNAGAIWTSRGWTWRVDVRESVAAAEAVLRAVAR